MKKMNINCRREFDDKTSDEEKKRLRTEQICRDLNRIIMKSLYNIAPHLVESEVDIEPRHEAFWMVGGKLPDFCLHFFYFL